MSTRGVLLPLRGPLKKKYPWRRLNKPYHNPKMPVKLWNHMKLSRRKIKQFQNLMMRSLMSEWSVADLLGISHWLLHQWKQRGEEYEKDISKGKVPNGANEIYYDFHRAIINAKSYWAFAKGEKLMQEKGYVNTWRDIEILSRRNKRDWAKEEQMQKTNESTLPDNAYL